MGKDKKVKKKCCGKFVKKNKHCSSCPVTAAGKKKCKPDKSYCESCPVTESTKKGKKKEKDKKAAKKKEKG